MKKTSQNLMTTLVLALTVGFAPSIWAKTAEVKTFAELKSAIKDTTVDVINVAANIDAPCASSDEYMSTTAALQVKRNLTIQGKDAVQYTLKRTGSTSATGNGSYLNRSILEIYGNATYDGVTVTLRNIIFDGGAVWASGSTPQTRFENRGDHPSYMSTAGNYYGKSSQNSGVAGHSVIDVANKATLNLEGGAVVQNGECTNNARTGTALDKDNKTNVYGGGIRVECFNEFGGGTINVKSGAIVQDCVANKYGGGIGAYNLARINVYGGTIRRCSARVGGGIGVTWADDAYDSTTEGKAASKTHSGVISTSGGLIEDCWAQQKGGALSIEGTAKDCDGDDYYKYSRILNLTAKNCTAEDGAALAAFDGANTTVYLTKSPAVTATDCSGKGNYTDLGYTTSSCIYKDSASTFVEITSIHTLTFVDGVDQYGQVEVEDGRSAGAMFPADPARTGMVFTEWRTNLTDSATKITKDTAIYSDVTAYAYWVSIEVELTGADVERTSYQVMLKGVPLTPDAGKYYVPSNEPNITVCYTAEPGYYFTGDATTYSATVDTSVDPAVIVDKPSMPLHSHCICGTGKCSVGGHSHSTLSWTGWASTTTLPTTAGNWFLQNDVTLTAEYEPVDGVNLCLNGHTVKQSGTNQRVIKLQLASDAASDHEFTLTDCGTTGKITGGNYKNVDDNKTYGAGVSVYSSSDSKKAIFNFYGGSICGNTNSYNNQSYGCGGGVAVRQMAVMNMYGGSITQNAALFTGESGSQKDSARGGGILMGNDANVNVYGGDISYNVASRYGGGIEVNNDAELIFGGTARVFGNRSPYGGGIDGCNKVTITGGEIFENVADGTLCTGHGEPGKGGGLTLYVDPDKSCTFSVKDCKIYNNSATKLGGGIWYEGANGRTSLGGTLIVTNNTVSSVANNMEFATGKTVALSSLAADSKIGVTTVTAPTAYSPIAITSNGASSNVASFTSDNPACLVKFANDHLVLSVLDVEVRDPGLEHTTFQVLTNGAPVAKVGDKYLVPSNATDVAVVYIAEEPYYFSNRVSVITNAVVSTATDPVTLSDAPADPTLFVKVVPEDVDNTTYKVYLNGEEVDGPPYYVPTNAAPVTIVYETKPGYEFPDHTTVKTNTLETTATANDPASPLPTKPVAAIQFIEVKAPDPMVENATFKVLTNGVEISKIGGKYLVPSNATDVAVVYVAEEPYYFSNRVSEVTNAVTSTATDPATLSAKPADPTLFVQIIPEDVDNTTYKVYLGDEEVDGPPYYVPTNAKPVKIVYTADDGKNFPDGSTVKTNTLEDAATANDPASPLPAKPAAPIVLIEVQDPGLDHTTIKVYTNGVEISKVGDKYLVPSNSTDVSVVYFAEEPYYFSNRVSEVTNNLTKSQTSTNPATLSDKPAAPTLFVKVVPEELTNTTVKVYLNGEEVDGPPYYVPTNSAVVTIVYETDPGYNFPDGSTTKTNTLDSSATGNDPASPLPALPSSPVVFVEVQEPNPAMEHTTFKVLTNGVEITKINGKWLVPTNTAPVEVVYVADDDWYFTNRVSAVTNTVDATYNPVIDENQPVAPGQYVEVVPEDLDNTTVKVYWDDEEVSGPPYYVPSNASPVKVVYTADDGNKFPDGSTVKTNDVDTTTSPATVPETPAPFVPVASVTTNGVTTLYGDIDSAWANTIFPASATLKLLADIVLTNGMYASAPTIVDRDITLDLNDHVLSPADELLNSMLSINGTNSLALVDTAASKTKKYFTEGADGLWVLTNEITSLFVEGGVITGGKKNEAVSLAGGAEAEIRDVSFVGNWAPGDCGALYIEEADANIYSTRFYGNRAENNGGAIRVMSDSHVLLDHCDIRHNSAGANGGGIEMHHKCVLLDTTISDNAAAQCGAGIYFVNDDACLAAGTKVLMADGTEKLIENIVVGDLVSTFDHEGGTNASARIYMTYEGPAKARPFTLYFDNPLSTSTSSLHLSIVGVHDLLEETSRKYVRITKENASTFVGKRFYGRDGVWHTLTSVTAGAESVAYYSIYSAQHQNVYANGLLTVPDDSDYILNLYELDANLKADPEQLASDIATYGLADPDRAAAQYGMDRQRFDDSATKYIYIAIGKGLVTLDYLVREFESMGSGVSSAPAPLLKMPFLKLSWLEVLSELKLSDFDDFGDGILVLGTNVVVTNNFVGAITNSNIYLANAESKIVFADDHAGTIAGVTRFEAPGEITTTNDLTTAADVAYLMSDNTNYVIRFSTDKFLRLALLSTVTPESVEGASYTIYTNGVPVTESSITVPDDVAVEVVYTADDGKYFPGGLTETTNTFDTTVNPAVRVEDLPNPPQVPIRYVAPVYKGTDNNPTNGIDHWVTNNCYAYAAIDDSASYWKEGWYVVTNEVTISDRIECEGEVNLILCPGAKLIAEYGITVCPDDASLAIYGQPDGAGRLEATVEEEGKCAAIGGAKNDDGGNITINAGTIIAIADLRYAAAIGGGYGGSGLNITINGGDVTANAGELAAAIGGSQFNKGENITINGGKVRVSCAEDVTEISELIGSGESGAAPSGVKIAPEAKVLFGINGPIQSVGFDASGIVTPGVMGQDFVLANGLADISALPTTTYMLTNAVTAATSNITVNSGMVLFADKLLNLVFADNKLTLEQYTYSIITNVYVEHTTATVYTNGYEVVIGPDGLPVTNNTPAYIVFTPDTGYEFPDHTTAKTNYLDTSVDPAMIVGALPPEPLIFVEIKKPDPAMAHTTFKVLTNGVEVLEVDGKFTVPTNTADVAVAYEADDGYHFDGGYTAITNELGVADKDPMKDANQPSVPWIPRSPDYASADDWLYNHDIPGKRWAFEPEEDPGIDYLFFYPTAVLSNDEKCVDGVCNIDNAEMRSAATNFWYGTGAVFGDMTHVYVPVYRQTPDDTEHDIITNAVGDANAAMADFWYHHAPYQDVTNVLTYYFTTINPNGERPFILGGHSHGSGMLALAMEHFFTEDETHKQWLKNMVACYAVGWGISNSWESALKANLGIDVATNATDSGVYVFWNTEGPGVSTTVRNVLIPNDPAPSVNPLTWSREAGSYAPASDNLGGWKTNAFMVIEPGLYDASNFVEHGTIVCSSEELANLPIWDGYLKDDEGFGRKSLHLWDYRAYWENARKSAFSRFMIAAGVEVEEQELANATFMVLLDGEPVEKIEGKYLVPSNSTHVAVVYTADDGCTFSDGETSKTNQLTAAQTKTDPVTLPEAPNAPFVPVASVTTNALTTFYADINDAWKDAADGEELNPATLTLLEDIALTNQLEIQGLSGAFIKLDLNDHVLSSAITESEDLHNKMIFFSSGSGHLEITDLAAVKTKKYFTALESGLWSLTNEATSLFVEGGVITGAKSNTAVYVSQGGLDVRGISFVGNHAKSDGAALYVNNEPINIYNTRFYGNVAGKSGGAICGWMQGKFLLKGCDVRYNVAGEVGGGIWANNKCVLLDTTVSDNIAAKFGAGVCLTNNTSCLAAGTMVLMADGTEKAVEDIAVGDLVATFDHEGGTNASARIYLVYEGPVKARPFTLDFDNPLSTSTSSLHLSIVGVHDLLEETSRKYVRIDEASASTFVGKRFYGRDGAWHTLTGVTYAAEEVKYYSVYSAQHQNVYANGLLTAPDDADYLLNIFELDANLKADSEQLASDIATYGLVDHDDVAVKYGMDRQRFDDGSVKYFYISIGKGLVTLDELVNAYMESGGGSAMAEETPKITEKSPVPFMRLGAGPTEPSITDYASYGTGVLVLGPNTVITNNLVGGITNCNVYLASASSRIVLDEDHTGVIAGVTRFTAPGQITATNNITAADVVYLTSDDPAYVTRYSTNQYLRLALLSTVTPEAVDGATYTIYTNGVPVTEPSITVPDDVLVEVVYEAEPGKYFPDGFTELTNTFDVTVNPAARVEDLPEPALDPIEYVEPVYVGGAATNGIAYWTTNTLYGFHLVKDSATAVAWQSGWYAITNADLEIEGGVTCAGDVRLVLCKDAKLVVTNVADNMAGVATDASGSFTIYGQPDGAGKLEVFGGSSAAGIGGGFYEEGSAITINGGTVMATGGFNSAGVGGGIHGDGSDITINGGYVIAQSGGNAAGIGGGSEGKGSEITINGGAVTAIANKYSAAIGGGEYADGSNIVINGGTVTAISGVWGAAIGGGIDGKCSNVTISNAVVAVCGVAGTQGGVLYCPELIGNGANCVDAASGIVIDSSAKVLFNLTSVWDADYDTWLEAMAEMPASFDGFTIMTPMTQGVDRVLVGGCADWTASTFALTNAATAATGSLEINGHDLYFASRFLSLTNCEGRLTLMPVTAVEILPEDVEHTSYKVYRGDEEITPPPYLVPTNAEPVYIVYTADDEYLFPDGTSEKTNSVDTTTEPATILGTTPDAPVKRYYDFVIADDFANNPLFLDWDEAFGSFTYDGVAYTNGVNAFTSFEKAFSSPSAPVTTNIHVFGLQTIAEEVPFVFDWRMEFGAYEISEGETNAAMVTIGTLDDGSGKSGRLVSVTNLLDDITGNGFIVLSVTNGTPGSAEYESALTAVIGEENVSVIYANLEPTLVSDTNPNTGNPVTDQEFEIDDETQSDPDGTIIIPGADTDGRVVVIVKEEATNDVVVAGKLTSREWDVVIVNESTNTLTVGAVDAGLDIIVTNLLNESKILTRDQAIAGRNVAIENNGYLEATVVAANDITVHSLPHGELVGSYSADNIRINGEMVLFSNAVIAADSELTLVGTNVIAGPVDFDCDNVVADEAEVCWVVADDNHEAMIDFTDVATAGSFCVLVDAEQAAGDSCGEYVIATNAVLAEGKSFKLVGLNGLSDAVVVGGETRFIGAKAFTLSVNAQGKLIFTVAYGLFDVYSSTMTVGAEPSAGGSIVVTNEAIYGTEVSVSAITNLHWQFNGWSGTNMTTGADLVFADASALETTFTMVDSDVDILATFALSEVYREESLVAVSNEANKALEEIRATQTLTDDERAPLEAAVRAALDAATDAIVAALTPPEVEDALETAKVAYNTAVTEAENTAEAQIRFESREIVVTEGSIFEVVVYGGSTNRTTAAKVTLNKNTYSFRTHYDADDPYARIVKVYATIDGVEKRINFPLTLDWVKGDREPKKIRFELPKSSKKLNPDRFFTLQLGSEVAAKMGPKDVCQVTIVDQYEGADEPTPYVRALANPANGGKARGSGKLKKATSKRTLRAVANRWGTFAGWYKADESAPNDFAKATWISDAKKIKVTQAEAGTYFAHYTNVTAVIAVRDPDFTTADVEGVFTNEMGIATGVAGVKVSFPLSYDADPNSKPRLSVSKLPKGLRYNRKTGLVTGVLKKAGTYEVVVKGKNVAGKHTLKFKFEVLAMSSEMTGKFVGDLKDVGSTVVGSAELKVKSNGSVSATITYAGKKYSFSGKGFTPEGECDMLLEKKNVGTVKITLGTDAQLMPDGTYSGVVEGPVFGDTQLFFFAQ